MGCCFLALGWWLTSSGFWKFWVGGGAEDVWDAVLRLEGVGPVFWVGCWMGCHWLVLLVQVCGAVGSSLSGFEVLVRVPVWSAPELAPRSQKNLSQQQHHELKHQQNQPVAPLPATRPRRLEPTPQSHNTPQASSAPPHHHTGPRRRGRWPQRRWRRSRGDAASREAMALAPEAMAPTWEALALAPEALAR